MSSARVSWLHAVVAIPVAAVVWVVVSGALAYVLGDIALGGLLYTAGAVVYGLKRPDPSPTWFGFHEIFHALTLLGFASHYTAAMLAVLRLPAG